MVWGHRVLLPQNYKILSTLMVTRASQWCYNRAILVGGGGGGALLTGHVRYERLPP